MNKPKADRIRSELVVFFDEIERKADNYGSKKKVKYIFKEVHDKFFRKYEIDSYFSDIFHGSGTYNCVTATALYAMAFDHLHVPYKIKETPTHVFLVAYPNSLNIYIETTLPGKSGSYAPSEALVKKAVDNLVEMKLITPSELAADGYNKVYSDFYYGDENILKKDLVGIQYYNKAIFHMNNEAYEVGYGSLSKAQELYVNERTKLFDEGLLALIVQNGDFGGLKDFHWFLEYCEKTEDLDYLKYRLSKILTNKNWSNEDLMTIGNGLKGITKDGTMKELLEVFYIYMADKYHKLQNVNKALHYANSILELNSENLTAKNYVSIHVIDRLALKNNSEKRLEELQDLVEKYPFLPDFGIYNRYRVFLFSSLVIDSYSKDNPGKGEEYLHVLQTIFEESDNVPFNELAIGNAYGAVGAFYYRKGQIQKAKGFLKRGLELSPENESITRKLHLIKNSN